ncbi:MAG: hypothetical protein FRX48_09714 [Lasallia pustulata]|uniref:Uncharacterized protein n=1 Tax=Lasallia pustulata TaxID=136370 RepID=A0A5M8PB72_9LECA|nr:MAG: hypothetical protein FRX48_09714 [Lasallia pustulata]
MNTIRSTWIGWGSLIIAGGGAYYFAKRSVNADRAARHEADLKRRRLTESLEYSAKAAPAKQNQHKSADHAGSPSMEASIDLAPTQHGREAEGQQAQEKSKYEASQPFRARKGDRFS